MAINNWTDYSKIKPQDSPWTNALENVLSGYKMSQEPAKMAEEQKKRQLANGIKGLELEHKPKEYELDDKQKELTNALKEKVNSHYEENFKLDRNLKMAKIQQALQKKVGGSTKANGELANFIVSHPNASQEEVRKAYDEIHGSKLAHEQATTNRSKDITAGNSFDKLPVDERKRAVGLTTAMGIDPIEATKIMRSGKGLEEIAKEKGVKLSDLTPIYPLGGENVKQLQKRSGYVAELKNLETKVAEPLSRYPSKVRGYSFDQIVDSVDIKDPKAMGEVLAARALSPEIAALRLKVAGGNIGIEAINALTDKSLQDMKIIEGLVTPEVYLETQKNITKWLEEAADSFKKNQEEYGRLKTSEERAAERESNNSGSSHSGKTYDLVTRSWS